jgi:hypothetical protein
VFHGHGKSSLDYYWEEYRSAGKAGTSANRAPGIARTKGLALFLTAKGYRQIEAACFPA